MKLMIDIPEEYLKTIKAIPDETSSLDMLLIKYGTPFDSVIEDIKAELTKDYVDDNPDNFRYTTVMLKDVLAIIDKHISGKETE